MAGLLQMHKSGEALTVTRPGRPEWPQLHLRKEKQEGVSSMRNDKAERGRSPSQQEKLDET
ncbi:hypothetical protein GCM10007867_04660 [Gluconobacter cerinus]|uniref:Uncharacterized protein n=1 Tax=Gluconobacter cerinus TaxID=38307 RepID=A0AAV5NAZ0_9PROT|nr:hypothetical protein HK24_02850 [Gluconobacter sp. DsW_058]GLQ61621.1 hypothetical protein GCM10007867_04660 [Gluconobacter cerinus]